MGAEGKVAFLMPGVLVVLEVKVGYETVTAKIVRKWGRSTVGSDSEKRYVIFVKIQSSLIFGITTRS